MQESYVKVTINGVEMSWEEAVERGFIQKNVEAKIETEAHDIEIFPDPDTETNGFQIIVDNGSAADVPRKLLEEALETKSYSELLDLTEEMDYDIKEDIARKLGLIK